MKHYYYAIKFISGRSTTTGTPNTKTGRMSVACRLVAFKSSHERDLWVADGRATYDMSGNCREAITRRGLRQKCLGMSVSCFNDLVEGLKTELE